MNDLYQTDATVGYVNGILPVDQGSGFPYMAIKYDSGTGALGELMEGNLHFTIPKGIYSPDQIGELVTTNMSNLRRPLQTSFLLMILTRMFM